MNVPNTFTARTAGKGWVCRDNRRQTIWSNDEETQYLEKITSFVPYQRNRSTRIIRQQMTDQLEKIFWRDRVSGKHQLIRMLPGTEACISPDRQSM